MFALSQGLWDVTAMPSWDPGPACVRLSLPQPTQVHSELRGVGTAMAGGRLCQKVAPFQDSALHFHPLTAQCDLGAPWALGLGLHSHQEQRLPHQALCCVCLLTSQAPGSAERAAAQAPWPEWLSWLTTCSRPCVFLIRGTTDSGTSKHEEQARPHGLLHHGCI